jgi:hypothetical protein
MPYRPNDTRVAPPGRRTGACPAELLRSRFAARLHIDLRRVSGAICQD